MRTLAARFVQEGLKQLESWRFDEPSPSWSADNDSLPAEAVATMQDELQQNLVARKYDRIGVIVDAFLGNTSLLKIEKGSDEYHPLSFEPVPNLLLLRLPRCCVRRDSPYDTY